VADTVGGDIPEASHRSSKHQETAVAPREQVSHKIVMVKASRSRRSKGTPVVVFMRVSKRAMTCCRSDKLQG
jgi:hypothetical protein